MSGACAAPVGGAESECEKPAVAEEETKVEMPGDEIGQAAGSE